MCEDQEALDLATRLKRRPKLLARVEGLLKVVENADGDIKKAAEAEMRVITEVRQIGHEALQSWASDRVEKTGETAHETEGARSAGKKNFPGAAPLASLK